MKWKAVLKKNYHQLIFVFIAFLLMILVSIISMSYITRQKLLSASEEALHTVEANIKMNLGEPEATLVGATFTVQNMVVNQEATNDEVLQYLTDLTDWLLENDTRVSGFNGIYGVIRDEYLDGVGWVPPEDYVPKERPWYIAAKENADEIAMTAPYIDAQTQVGIISFSKEVRDTKGKSIGVVSLDIMLTRLTEYVGSLQQRYGGYGILLDSDFSVIAHPNKNFAGKPIAELSEDYAEIAAELKAGSGIQGKTIKDTDGTRMMLFFRKLYNGWYIGMLTPADRYYADMYRMDAILITMGIILMCALSLILMRLAAAKLRSDEENKLKSSFLARMSHEIRTPMNAILGMVELILRKELPTEVREEALQIKHAGTNLLSIIGDILDFSKIESNRMEIVSAEYRLVSLLDDVINIIRMRVNEDSVLFVVNVDSKLPSVLEGDEVRLRQVLLNLLSNAVKYTRSGHVWLTVSGNIADGDTVMLSFNIADTGIGIKEENLDKLFGDFTQFDMQKNMGIEGTGLGLAIARNLCILMGGDITVSSKYGKGSVFTANVPQRIAAAERLAEADSPEMHRVLIYERREIYANSIMRSIKNLDVSCFCAADHKNLMEALRRDKYSFVFTSPFLYDAALGAITQYESEAKIVVLAAREESASFAEALPMSMPAYCVSIANILNGVAENGAYDEPDSFTFRFVAPAARILVVDDVEINLRVAEGMLSPYEAQIDCCLSGSAAIELVKKNNYDIVFMDHMMPEMDGIEAVKRIRSMPEERFQSLPIVALTANAVSGMKEMFLENKFSGYLTKPIDMDELNAVMQKIIPEEKRMSIDVLNESSFGDDEFELCIDGVDTKLGIIRTGGVKELYMKVLEVFCRDGTERLNMLKEAPTESELLPFVTQVHALKSASANIGATDLSEKAALLERAGQIGCMEEIVTEIGAFQTELEALIKNIEAALNAYTSKLPESIGGIDSDALRRLKAALEEGNIEAIDSVSEELGGRAYKAEEKKAVSKLFEYILVSDFDEAIQLIESLLRGD